MIFLFRGASMKDRIYPPNIQKRIDKLGGLEAYRESMRQVRQGNSLIPSKDAVLVVKLYKQGSTQNEIADKMNIGQTTVSIILKKHREYAD